MEDRGTGFYLKMINGIMEKHFNHKLQQYELTKSQFDFLRFLKQREDQDIIQRDIETFFHVSNPTVTGILNRLEDKGFIIRTQSRKDRRIHRIVLTAKAQRVFEELHPGKQELDNFIASHLSREDAATLNRLLKSVFESLIEQEETVC